MSTSSSYAYDLGRSISNSSQNDENCSDTSFLSSNKKNGIETWQWELGGPHKKYKDSNFSINIK